MGLTKERIKRTSTERGRYGDGGGVSAWNRRDRSTGLTRPRYPGNRMGELCCCSRLHGERSVYVCVCLCGYKCIKSNTGFLSANNKAHGFTWLCWDLEIHCGSRFSSQRRVYAFCTEECQQPWGFLQRVTGVFMRHTQARVSQMEPEVQKNRQCAERDREMKTLSSVWCTLSSCFLHRTLFFLRLVII